MCPQYNLKSSLYKKNTNLWSPNACPVRSKTVINNVSTEQVSNFSYLDCDKNYDTNNYINNKIHRFEAMCGTVNNLLSSK